MTQVFMGGQHEMDPKEIGWKGVDWTNLVQDRDKWQAIVNVVMNFWMP